MPLFGASPHSHGIQAIRTLFTLDPHELPQQRYKDEVARLDLPRQPDEDVRRQFVWYSAADDNTEVTLPPVWDVAKFEYGKLKGHHPDPNQRIEWVHKNCYGRGWSKGEDYEDCPLDSKLPNHLTEFPTLRLYTDVGEDDFQGERTVPELVNFVRRTVDPPEILPSRNPPYILDAKPVAHSHEKGDLLAGVFNKDQIHSRISKLESRRDELTARIQAITGGARSKASPEAAHRGASLAGSEVFDLGVGQLLGCAGAVFFSASRQDLRRLQASRRPPAGLVPRSRAADCSGFL